MPQSFQHFELKLVSPEFDSSLTDTVMELNHLRKLELSGTTAPWTFFQMKGIFHLLESVGSARIEGNRTTVSEYVDQKIESQEKRTESFTEIENVETAMSYIEEHISTGTKITHQFIRELHHLVVDGLSKEGDKSPGAYRTWDVEILKSSHKPPPFYRVEPYMTELLEFMNRNDSGKYDLLKTAISHHRFTWVHPFGNGNGRVVRLLTYALLIKYGFNVKEGKLLNPTAVFCNDRDKYYSMLSEADRGLEHTTLKWCDYVLSGILSEINKINRLLNFEYVSNNILLPTVDHCHSQGILSVLEMNILKIGILKQKFRSPDLASLLSDMTPRQRTHQITKMKERGLIAPLKKNGRTYHVNFTNNILMRGVIRILEQEGFIPSIDT